MKPIIPPVDKTILISELSKDIFLRKTNNANNEIYAFTAHQCPQLMRELGRIREITFRAAGGGTGEEMDIDYFDTCPNAYTQLIVWNPIENEIVGGYRYIKCKDGEVDKEGEYVLATSHLFNFSEKFKINYLPYTIELGRSFVQPKYQATKENRSGLYALDNLWDGLGALIVNNSDIKYFFGKVTMYNHYNRNARNLLLFFMNKYFPDVDKLVTPKNPIFNFNDFLKYEKRFRKGNFNDDFKMLQHYAKHYNETIPPLISAYMKLTSTMITFGTSSNDTFGEVEETGILITINDIFLSKKERHIDY